MTAASFAQDVPLDCAQGEPGKQDEPTQEEFGDPSSIGAGKSEKALTKQASARGDLAEVEKEPPRKSVG